MWEHIEEQNKPADAAFVCITNFGQSEYSVFNESLFSLEKL